MVVECDAIDVGFVFVLLSCADAGRISACHTRTQSHTMLRHTSHDTRQIFVMISWSIFSMPIQQQPAIIREFKNQTSTWNYQHFFSTFVNPNWLSVQKLIYKTKRIPIKNVLFFSQIKANFLDFNTNTFSSFYSLFFSLILLFDIISSVHSAIHTLLTIFFSFSFDAGYLTIHSVGWNFVFYLRNFC